MPQFDVYRSREGDPYLLDCQSNLLSTLSHRFVVPLVDAVDAPIAAVRLNPEFVLNGQRLVMLTQFAAAVPKMELGEAVGSLADHNFVITAAIDILTSGV